jgi:hypothetical protein
MKERIKKIIRWVSAQKIWIFWAISIWAWVEMMDTLARAIRLSGLGRGR